MVFYNPFRAQYHQDPYPELARLRAAEPVHASDRVRDWVVTGFEEAQRCLQDDDYFSNDPAHGRTMGPDIIRRRHETPLGLVPLLGQVDPPDHTRLRAVVNRAFTPRRVEALRPRIQQVAGVLIDRFPANQPVDFMRNFAEPFPVMVVLEMIGIPPPDHMAVRQWATAIMEPISTDQLPPGANQRALAARDQFARYLRESPRRLHDYREESVVNTLLESEADGTMTLDEVMVMIIHISLSGNGPTAFMLGNAALALASNPEQQQALHDNPGLMPNLVDETLRYDSPTHHVIRIVRNDLLLARKRLRKGDAVHVIIGAANRDPRRFPDPDTFDLAREDVRHLSFGHGIHFCLGAPLARLLGAVAYEKLLAHFGHLRLAPNGVTRGDTFLLRGPARLELEPA